MSGPVPEQIGHFRVLRLLGKGAMGEVFEGVDDQLSRRVALKILGAKHRESTEFKTRFLREGRALAAMNHPNIVQIYAIGEHERRPFLAMEFLDGEDIGGTLKRGGPLHPGDAAEIIRQSAVGLSEAQRAGVVHRDVKPSNLVVTTHGIVKVTDFGLAKALQEDLSITATGVFVGTPDYLAPEQAMGDEVDARADVYALGCSLYHMCSGHPPFRKGGQDDHYTAVVRRHLKAERPQLKLEIAGFDEELSDLCRRMMSRRPDVRPTFDELIQKLGDISRRLGGRVPPRHQDVELLKNGSPGDNDRTEPPVGGAGRGASSGSRTVMIAVVAGVAIGVCVSLVAIFAFQ
ncbi:MAG: serine/threonine protein kinase [Deltaproteobacteria bacterium]|jgi:serine/threonine protein kinase|nr:serine/threonine protein kinase [Deltaproteobacteria bacterium]MBK8234931.1 serine/threonine protein kinase [Deltaproteobacteria bacterium]MBP7285275.1 serine/threonine protein kinase [Nannocystaceae bacterium]